MCKRVLAPKIVMVKLTSIRGVHRTEDNAAKGYSDILRDLSSDVSKFPEKHSERKIFRRAYLSREWGKQRAQRAATTSTVVPFYGVQQTFEPKINNDGRGESVTSRSRKRTCPVLRFRLIHLDCQAFVSPRYLART